MTSVNITESYKTVAVSEGAGKTVIVTAPSQAVTVSTVGLGPQGPGGDIGLYANFIDTTDQPLASTAANQVITFNTTLGSRGISLVDNSKITFALNGTYKILASLQLTNSGNNISEVNVFFKKNGNTIADSNTRIDLEPRKSASAPYHGCFTIEFQLDLVANDYVQIFLAADHDGIAVDTIPADALHPQAPSAIINVAQVLFAQAGVPTGGNPGDILTKSSSTNYDTAWAQIPGIAPKSFTVANPVAGSSFTIFRTSAPMSVSSIYALVRGSTPSVTYEIRYSTNRASSGTLAASPATATNTTTGSSAVVQNQPIPANSYVWLVITAVSGATEELNLSIAF